MPNCDSCFLFIILTYCKSTKNIYVFINDKYVKVTECREGGDNGQGQFITLVPISFIIIFFYSLD